MTLPTLTINRRIYAGCSILVGLAIAAAMLGVYQLNEIQGRVGAMDQITANTLRVREAARLGEVVRRAELKYRAEPKPAVAA